MKRLFWGVGLMVLTVSLGWSQSTWRGQAEIWPAATAPTEGFVAASNEFPRNSLLTVENYKTKKTVQVRVVAVLPTGSSALVLLNARAAQALDIKVGEAPLVGVRLDPTGVERADNPDPDVNPLAVKPAAPPAVVPAAATTPAVPLAVAPASPAVPAGTDEVPTAAPSAAVLPVVPQAEALPLPALADAGPEASSGSLPVSDETEAPVPLTPGKKVFVTTREPEPVAVEPEVEVEMVTIPEAPAPAVEPATEAETVTVLEVPAPAVEPSPVEAVAETLPADAVAAEVPPAPKPEAPPAETPKPEPAPLAASVVPAAPALVVPSVPQAAWVSVPGRLEGSVLGPVGLLTGLEKGRHYVQLAAFGTETEVLKVLSTVKSYVPLALYKAEGEKNPWRVVVAAAPKAQLGFLLMHYRSQGFRAALVKG